MTSREYLPDYMLEPKESRPICTCPYCGEDIYPGDEIIEFEGDKYHVECFQDQAYVILCNLYDLRVKEASRDE